jgi:hypothetical protein
MKPSFFFFFFDLQIFFIFYLTFLEHGIGATHVGFGATRVGFGATRVGFGATHVERGCLCSKSQPKP